MAQLVWDAIGTREFETGIDRCVLYIPTDGVYDNGVAWSGITGVTESPSGAEATALYADNIKYLTMISAEQFAATLTCYTYPDEWALFDGQLVPVPGLKIGQQSRKSFGLAYRTRLGNDVKGDALGYKLHLIYGCTATPSEKQYQTVNESPSAIEFSYEISTLPVPITVIENARPTSIITIDSTDVGLTKFNEFCVILWGDNANDPRLPMPDEVITFFTDGDPLTVAVPANPTYNSGTHTITIPSVTGVVYKIAGTTVTGTVVLTTGQTKEVVATFATGYGPPATAYDNRWVFSY